jgi:hypothetical protein
MTSRSNSWMKSTSCRIRCCSPSNTTSCFANRPSTYSLGGRPFCENQVSNSMCRSAEMGRMHKIAGPGAPVGSVPAATARKQCPGQRAGMATGACSSVPLLRSPAPAS